MSHINTKKVSPNSFRRITLAVFAVVSISYIFVWLAVAMPVFNQPSKLKSTVTPDALLLQSTVATLTQMRPYGNYQNPAGLAQAAAYINNYFQNYCDEALVQEYSVDNAEVQDAFITANLICVFNAEKPQTLVIGAHYDVAGDKPGADDNASGVAGLLELSRMLSATDLSKLNHRIELVAYSLEEPPAFRNTRMGSLIHAQSLVDQNRAVIAMLSLEMIGYFSDQPNSQRLVTPLMKLWYPTTGDFIAIVGNMTNQRLVRQVKRGMSQGLSSDFEVFSLNAPRKLPGVDYSDHRNYWDLGFPAVMVTDTSFYRNPHYHQATDTADTLDFDRMAQVVNGVYIYSLSL